MIKVSRQKDKTENPRPNYEWGIKNQLKSSLPPLKGGICQTGVEFAMPSTKHATTHPMLSSNKKIFLVFRSEMVEN